MHKFVGRFRVRVLQLRNLGSTGSAKIRTLDSAGPSNVGPKEMLSGGVYSLSQKLNK